ncbi:hypothetical protein KC340_g9625 [Hortaea werneckii]|nr:hypothetical protein KC342_g10025 [Hortaea werneckii]KAI7102470.1 hypothetical protein KC339_g5975 [Hortaea werneckii]KAI7240448.1 hypothetical protein KC365_g3789 [Hortaea werneckii]KAI7313194.1 hypothetical protein KC340_g9625 [Hortaea werneckii]KAI7384312.1 hypothetical protein KC328_g10846 [Hortaea werneckii]
MSPQEAIDYAAIYQPLDARKKEIRIILVYPSINLSTGDQLPVCRLQTASLLDEPTPHYEAISYAWGERTGVAPIIINDQHRQQPASAVRVAMMSDVYRNSSQTLVWLGDEDANTAAAFEQIDIILKDKVTELGTAYPTQEQIESFKPYASSYSDRTNRLGDVAAFRALLSRSWFSHASVRRADFNLAQLLSRGLHLQVSDPKDKIFAGLGLVQATMDNLPRRLQPQVDYNRSLCDIYAEATFAAIVDAVTQTPDLGLKEIFESIVNFGSLA